MLKPGLSWPLEINIIRRNSVANTFGMVRENGKRAHQGWDLLAYPGTRCYAIADGTIALIVPSKYSPSYGLTVVLEFKYRRRTLYAAYTHLSITAVREDGRVVAGQWLGLTGNTGNAKSMKGDDQHLHFEIRTIARPGETLAGRLDPADLFGPPPLRRMVFDGRSPETLRTLGRSGPVLKIPGVNVL